MLKPYLHCFTALSVMLAASSALAGNLDDAKKLMADGKPLPAYQLLAADKETHLNDADYVYTMAVAAADASVDLNTIISLLEQSIRLAPDNYGSHLDMGVACFHAGKYDEARSEFMLVEKQNPPAGANKVIKSYLAAIDERDRVMSIKSHAFVEGGVGFDSNINSSTSQQQVAIPLFGNALLSMNQTNVKTGAGYATVTGGIDGLKPVTEDIALFGAASASARSHFSHSEFDNMAPDVRGGIILASANHIARVALFANQYYLNGSRSREGTGLAGDWYYVLDENNRAGLFVQRSDYRFSDTTTVTTPTMPNENFRQDIVGATWSHLINGDTVSVALMAGQESAPHRMDGDKEIWSARVSGEHKLDDRFSLLGGAGYQQGRYQKQNALFLTNREDEQHDLGASLAYRYSKDVLVRAQYTHVSTRSNIELYLMNRDDVSVVIRMDI